VLLLRYSLVYMLAFGLKQSSQSLWNRLSVLLNLLPEGSKILETGERSRCYYFFFIIEVEISFNFPHNAIFSSRSVADLGLNKDVTELLSECEQPGLVQTLLLPEDLALRHLPALSVAHRRLDFTSQRPPLTPLDEVTSHLPLYVIWN